MFQYDENACNIKDCGNKHFKILLCKVHYQQYIVDEKVKKIQTNVFIYSFGKPTILAKVKYYLRSINHHLYNSKEYYIEHFPLESVFLYHFYNINIPNNKNYSVNQFIKDFDYDENPLIDHLKTVFNTSDSNKRLIEFAATKTPRRQTILYIIFYLLFCSALLYSFVFLNKKIPYFEFFRRSAIIFLLSIPVVHLGLTFIKNSKEILNLAIENNLYNEAEDNQKFLKESQSILNRIRRNKALMYSIYGVFTATAIISVILFIKEFWSLDFSVLFLTAGLAIAAILMAFIIFSVLWQNLYIVPISRRFHDAPFKMNVYALNKNLGIDKLKAFLRTLLLYNIFTLATIGFFAKDLLDTSIILYLAVFYFVGWNVTSFVFIIKLRNYLNRQFETSITREKLRLEDPEVLDRINKYKFIEELKLNLFFKWSFIIKPFLYVIPFLIKFVLDQYGQNILEYVTKQINPK